MRPIDADALMDYCNSQKVKTIDANDIARFPTIGGVAKDNNVLGKWASVKDRLPEDGCFVLVCNDDNKMMIAKYESEVIRWEYKYTSYDWDVWDDEEQGPVRWWMPLPEAPKEEHESLERNRP